MKEKDLLHILNDLRDNEFKDFKWALKYEKVDGIPPIKESQLSEAERRDVVDLMVQKYELAGAVKVFKSVLKINRNDLVRKLLNISSGAEGQSQEETNMTSHPDSRSERRNNPDIQERISLPSTDLHLTVSRSNSLQTPKPTDQQSTSYSQVLHLHFTFEEQKIPISDRNRQAEGSGENLLYHRTTQDNCDTSMKTGFKRHFVGKNGYGSSLNMSKNSEMSKRMNEHREDKESGRGKRLWRDVGSCIQIRVNQDNAIELEQHAIAGPSTLQFFTNPSGEFPDNDSVDNDTYDGDSSYHSDFNSSSPYCSPSINPTVAGPLHLQGRPIVFQDSTVKNFTKAKRSPDMLLKDSFEEFMPDITVNENEETCRFHCSRPGLYQCSVTGLVFHMEGEGDMVYRIVSWNRSLLAQHHKKPAGPLFHIKCLQKSVCWLHLPHCEIRSTGGCDFLSVAHVNDEDIEFITPHNITETHVIINITEFSGFGVVKDEDSPPVKVQALVLLFYRPPTDPDPESVLNVLLLPRNVVLRDVKRKRKQLVGDEEYIETPRQCKLLPKQKYTLSTSPEDASVLVQPTEEEFDEESYDNYVSSFQVHLKTVMKNIQLFLRDKNNSHSVWERRVCLLSIGVIKPQRRHALTLPSNERLMEIRTCFIDGISGPVLKCLLDKMFEKKVITDSERESVDEMQNKSDKARFVIDTVRKKGEAASSEMIEFLREIDPFLCKHLGLI